MQLFTLDGEFMTIWNDIQRPMDISVDSEGSVDDSSARVSVLDASGNVLARFDCRSPGHGSWVDSRGDTYVGLSDGTGIDKFVRQG